MNRGLGSASRRDRYHCPMNNTDALNQEWLALQDQYERYESGGLHIKLFTVALMVFGLATAVPAVWLCGLVVVLWLQEGIYRTFQSRLGQRILRVEGLIRQHECEASAGQQPAAFQLHSEWLAGRPGALTLVREYVARACRPTVAYPYVLILLGLAVWGVLPAFE